MTTQNQPIENLLRDLKERAKELSCLYEVEEILNRSDASPTELFTSIIKAIPAGWQYPDICQAKITHGDAIYRSPNFTETSWVLSANILVQSEIVGVISVCYMEEMPAADEGPFLKEERKLINTLAERLGRRILHQQLREVFERVKSAEEKKREWSIILDLLRRTDPQLLLRISRKMTNYLCWSGSKEADRLLAHFSPAYKNDESELVEDINRPHQKKVLEDFTGVSQEVFRIAIDFLGEPETLSLIQRWIKEDKSTFLVNILENPGTSHSDITDAIGRYHHLDPQGAELSPPREMAFRVSLIRRLLTSQPQFINIAKHFVRVNDFYDLLHRVIFPADSHGKLGGKSAGLFLAHHILKKSEKHAELFRNIKTPKSWYITSDGILNFMHYNTLEEVVEQKYKNIGQVRQEYPYVVQVFKNSPFPPEIIKGLSLALDDLGDVPLIVRSSSLLEDRMGTAFAGKYKSLFIANQGTKKERLIALMDAVAEVYASTFSPDPIEYRAERALLDFHEEMGIMIQEVVGARVGHYFFPSYAGVAFSKNNLRWSPRIKPEDGLVRIVPGLGTRAVDRLSDDYPILMAPGQPGLRVNVSVDEQVRYSPKKIDVINLQTNTFETVDLKELFRKHGHEFPRVNQVVSILEDDHISPPMGMHLDFEKDDLVVTFDGLLTRTPFVKQMHTVLNLLEEKLGLAVDIEFASDGEDFYLLQCRPQSHAVDSAPATIPRDIAADRLLFTANRYVSNGVVTGLTHVVYVDPQKYTELSSRSDLIAVGRAVGKLNQLLPKRQFILMGPGRWGSRGDIRLGVSVTYSDINNSAMLVEIARKKGNYLPDLSFGTHFFQDLVEASIRYLPLYPDDPNIRFNEEFFLGAKNILPELLPEFAGLAETVRVVDVAKTSGGLSLQVLMNAESEQVVGYLTESSVGPEARVVKSEKHFKEKLSDDHWRWRLRMAEHIAAQIDPQRFGVREMYVIGSAKNATAGPASDIDLLIHFGGSEKQRRELETWLEGWSRCLSEMNFLRTGIKTDELLDVHIITDQDIKKRTSYAVKIGAVTDAARKLSLANETEIN
jgi:predicted nucleotidyltransferase